MGSGRGRPALLLQSKAANNRVGIVNQLLRILTMKLLGMISIPLGIFLIGCLKQTTAFMTCNRKSSIIINRHSTLLHSTISPKEETSSILTDHLDNMTVLQLKELLRHQGLKVGGNKAELVERLLSNSDGKKDDEKKDIQKKIAGMAKVVKKKRATLLVNEGIPSPGLNRQVESRIKAVTEQIQSTVNSDSDDTATSTNVSFSDIQGLSASIVSRLSEMGITEPTPIQQQAIPIAMMGRDVMGTAQTGTGNDFGVWFTPGHSNVRWHSSRCNTQPLTAPYSWFSTCPYERACKSNCS